MLIVNQMKLLADLQDDQYPYKQITHNRIITRGVILNDKNEVLLLHLVGDDIFGHRDCYETPGGGIKPNETLEESLLREIKEETGIEAEIIKPIGYVSDYYVDHFVLHYSFYPGYSSLPLVSCHLPLLQ